MKEREREGERVVFSWGCERERVSERVTTPLKALKVRQTGSLQWLPKVCHDLCWLLEGWKRESELE